MADLCLNYLWRRFLCSRPFWECFPGYSGFRHFCIHSGRHPNSYLSIEVNKCWRRSFKTDLLNQTSLWRRSSFLCWWFSLCHRSFLSYRLRIWSRFGSGLRFESFFDLGWGSRWTGLCYCLLWRPLGRNGSLGLRSDLRLHRRFILCKKV